MERTSLRQILLAVLVLIVTGAAGWHAHKWHIHRHSTQGQRRIASPQYVYTSPLLDVELPEGLGIQSELQPFKFKVVALLNEMTASGRAKNVSVYFRDLHDGPWFQVNPGTEFNPASMMKVPVMIAWLKRAEKDRAVLRQKLRYDARRDPVPDQYTKPARSLESGKSYTIDELLHYMLNYSDNRATALLYKTLTEKELGEVLDNMDVNNDPNDEGNALTIHGYSGFFRILYNASYLNRDMSERALELLSLQDFPQGIAGGVPAGVKVASKFGEIVPADGTGEIQLHEFGIVYHPRHHYILGIMTRGHDFASQAGIIRELSSLFYHEMDDKSSH